MSLFPTSDKVMIDNRRRTKSARSRFYAAHMGDVPHMLKLQQREFLSSFKLKPQWSDRSRQCAQSLSLARWASWGTGIDDGLT